MTRNAVKNAKRTALITGASSGIGATFARQLAARKHNVVLVARREERLRQLSEQLTTRHGIVAEVLVADLADDRACQRVEDRLADSARPIDLLINNAGFGLNKKFGKGSVDDETRMLDVNVRAVMRLTHAAVPGMLERGHGEILNVSSVASFGPVSPGSTYSATKAWITNFSESLHLAYSAHGITVMALCPGLVHTEFHDTAQLRSRELNEWWWLSADDVVRMALRDLSRSKVVSVPTWRYKLVVGLIRHLPRSLLYRGLRWAQPNRTSDADQ